MSTKFKPNKGDRFYVSFKPMERVINDFGFLAEATVVKQVDRSYCDDIFECLGSDDVLIVGQHLIRTGLAAETPLRFRISDCTFDPVGPEVIEALGLGEPS